MNIFGKSIEGITNKLVKKYEKALEGAKAFDASNYPKKLSLLKEKLTEEYKLWSMKRSKYPNRFDDVERDIEYVKVLMDKPLLGASERENINRLCKKYSITQ
jgi:hypothetical protein